MEEVGDPPAAMPVLGGVTYSSPVAFEDVAPEDFRTIGNILWFRRQAVLADAESNFVVLDRYEWEGYFNWGVATDTLRSRVWRDAIAFDEIDLSTRVGLPNKMMRYIRDVYKWIMSVPYAPSIEAGLEVDLWRYRKFRERPYVELLTTPPPRQE